MLNFLSYTRSNSRFSMDEKRNISAKIATQVYNVTIRQARILHFIQHSECKSCIAAPASESGSCGNLFFHSKPILLFQPHISVKSIIRQRDEIGSIHRNIAVFHHQVECLGRLYLKTITPFNKRKSRLNAMISCRKTL